MASPSHEEGEAFPQSAGGGLGFDVSVFRTYLASLLPPGPCGLELSRMGSANSQ